MPSQTSIPFHICVSSHTHTLIHANSKSFSSCPWDKVSGRNLSAVFSPHLIFIPHVWLTVGLQVWPLTRQDPSPSPQTHLPLPSLPLPHQNREPAHVHTHTHTHTPHTSFSDLVDVISTIATCVRCWRTLWCLQGWPLLRGLLWGRSRRLPVSRPLYTQGGSGTVSRRLYTQGGSGTGRAVRGISVLLRLELCSLILIPLLISWR